MRHDHAPAEKRTDTVTVECATSGPERLGYDSTPYKPPTLADVEAWCEALRRWGASDDLVLPDAEGLTVKLNVAAP